jgi:hypothetical protein
MDIQRDAETCKRLPFEYLSSGGTFKAVLHPRVMSHDAQDILRFGKKKFGIALHPHVSQTIRANLSNQVNLDAEARQFL